MNRFKGLLWWGYIDDEGVIEVKRYTTDRVIENYERMPFCKGIFEPFQALDKEEAYALCYARVSQEANIKWKGKPE